MELGDLVWVDGDGQEWVGFTGLTLEQWLAAELDKER